MADTVVQSPEGEEPPPLHDPYAFIGVPPPPPRKPRRTRVSGLAVASILSALLLGPPGAILAIVLGYLGRRGDVPEEKPPGAWLATVGMLLGALLIPTWGVGLSYLAWRRILRDDEPRFGPVEPRAAPTGRSTDPPSVARGPVRGEEPRVDAQGRVTVVDLPPSTPSLVDALVRQRAEAVAAQETLVLMTTGQRCDPCRGVDLSLRDPLMQSAVARVRLVRADVAVFNEDLTALHIPVERIPGFYLLAPDFTPRDGIDGGEWDEDIPANIAPVLGPFVRGKYKKRRQPWRAPPGSGVTL